MHKVQNPAPYLQVIREVKDYATLVFQTALYLQNELAYLPMSESWRERLNDLCDEMILTKHLVLDELMTFETLAMNEPWEEEYCNLCASMVKAFLPTLEKLRVTSQNLQQACTEDVKYQFSFILLAEAFSRLWDQHLPLEQALVNALD